MNNNELTGIPVVLKQLKHLVRLNLGGNEIGDLKGIEKLKRLQCLVLDHNKIPSVVKEVVNLKRLEILQCNCNNIREIPRDIRHLKNLREIDFSQNDVSLLPPEIFMLPKLEALNMSCNQLQRIPTINFRGPIKHRITSLDLSENVMTKFPEHLLMMVDNLDVSSNRIKSVQGNIIKKLEWRTDISLDLCDNPITNPPIEICEGGLRPVIQYFKEARIKATLYQGLKILVMGKQGAGKTSLVQTLLDQQTRLTDPDEATSGCEVYDMNVDIVEADGIPKPITYTFWDMSGHPFYLYSHYFLLDQPYIGMLVFQLAEYKAEDFYSTFGAWIDWMISKSNKLSLLVVGTQSDKVSQTQAAETCELVNTQIHDYLREYREDMEREMKILEGPPDASQRISPAMQDQLKKLRVWSRFKMFVHTEVIPTSACTLENIEHLQNTIDKIVQNRDVFLNILRVIPTLWLDVEEYIEDLGNEMAIPLMRYVDLEEKIAEKFSMRHLVQSITEYLHEIGKLMWFSTNPHLKEFVFLRPIWFMDIVKGLFRHDFVERTEYSSDEYHRQLGVPQFKFDRFKKEYQSEGILDRDLVRCLWMNDMSVEHNLSKSIINEILGLFVENLQLAYPIRRTGKEGMWLNPDPPVLESAKEKKKQKEKEKADLENADQQSNNGKEKTPAKPKSFPRLLVPYLRRMPKPDMFDDEWNKYVSTPRVAVVFTFPHYMPPGFFDNYTIRAHNPALELCYLKHWFNGVYARHSTKPVRVLFLCKHDDDDAGAFESAKLNEAENPVEPPGVETQPSPRTDGPKNNTSKPNSHSFNVLTDGFVPRKNTEIRLEVRMEESTPGEEEHRILWSVLLPLINDMEHALSLVPGVRVQRRTECPSCRQMSFYGEWLTPKEFQGTEDKPCPMCKVVVSTAYLVQPRERKSAEEMLKLMKITGRFPNGEKKKRPPRSQILYYEEVPAGEQSGVEVLRPLKF